MSTSCKKDRNADLVFDKPSQERLEDKFAEYNDLLKSSENGWKMSYYPDSEKFGGYNFLFKFEEDGRVVMESDFEEGMKNSSYKIYGGQGVVLSFDSYNMLHILADPGIYSAGIGYNGDYELIVERSTSDSLVCRGRKWDQPMILTRATSDDWDNMDQIKIHEKAMAQDVENSPFFRNLRENNQGISTFFYNSNTRLVEYFYVDNIGITHSDKSPLIFTKEGFSLKDKITVNGKDLKDFGYDTDTDSFTFGTDGTVTAEHFSAIEFKGAWEAFTSKTGASLSYAGKDFFSLFRRLRKAEPQFAAIQLYWNISGYKLLSFVFGNGVGVDGYHWWHSLIRSIDETSEDTVIINAAISGATGGRYIFNNNPDYQEEYQRLFVDFNDSSEVIDEIMDVIYNKEGLTIIPTSDENIFYVVSKKRSNYWVKFSIF